MCCAGAACSNHAGADSALPDRCQAVRALARAWPRHRRSGCSLAGFLRRSAMYRGREESGDDCALGAARCGARWRRSATPRGASAGGRCPGGRHARLGTSALVTNVASPGPAATRDPVLREEDGGLSLHFEDGAVQSRMIYADPARPVLEYTRLMMGFLLFQPAPARSRMIGLGGGSLAKYCALKLPEADFTAIEISPEVIGLREAFGVPPDGPRFRIVCEDGAAFVRSDGEPLDVLLVDGFDRGGQSEQLCSAAFCDYSRDRLTPGGA